jgi:prophage regulatory protein
MKMKIIRLKELSEMLCVSKSTIYRWRKQKLIPKPIELGPNIIGWDMRVIEEWLESIK